MGRQIGAALGVAVLVAVLGTAASTAADFHSAWLITWLAVSGGHRPGLAGDPRAAAGGGLGRGSGPDRLRHRHRRVVTACPRPERRGMSAARSEPRTRTRSFSWADPARARRPGCRLPGLEYLRGIVDGTLAGTADRATAGLLDRRGRPGARGVRARAGRVDVQPDRLGPRRCRRDDARLVHGLRGPHDARARASATRPPTSRSATSAR